MDWGVGQSCRIGLVAWRQQPIVSGSIGDACSWDGIGLQLASSHPKQGWRTGCIFSKESADRARGYGEAACKRSDATVTVAVAVTVTKGCARTCCLKIAAAPCQPEPQRIV